MPRQESKTLQQIEEELAPKVDARKEQKRLEVVRESAGLYTITFNAGGEVPDDLKGRWTTLTRAQAAIDNYEATHQPEAAE